MELRIIEDDILRVKLTRLDMLKYDIDGESLDYKNTKTRKAVWDILDEAYEKTGFDAAKGRIYIEAYPDKSGGCKIYITKLHDSIPPDDDLSYSLIKEGKMQETGLKKPSVYVFPELDLLLRVCRRLRRFGYSGESTAYADCKEKAGRFYLVIYEDTLQYQAKQVKNSCEGLFIGEFGTKLPSPEALSYINEHCAPVCRSDAVSTLSEL